VRGLTIAAIAAICAFTVMVIYAAYLSSTDENDAVIPASHQFGAIVSDKMMTGQWHE